MLQVDAATRSLDLEDVDYTLPPELTLSDPVHQEACEDTGTETQREDTDTERQREETGTERVETPEGSGSGGGGSLSVAVAEADVQREVDTELERDVAVMTALEKDLWQQVLSLFASPPPPPPRARPSPAACHSD